MEEHLGRADPRTSLSLGRTAQRLSRCTCMRTRYLTLLIPAAASAAVVAAALMTEAMHVRHLKGHAQAALDQTVAEVALRRTEPTELEAVLRSRVPGQLERVALAPPSDQQTIAVAELTLPSAWPSLKRNGYRRVVTSTVTIQPPGG